MMENGYGLNVFTGVDADLDENVRKQSRVAQSSGKGIHSRYCAKGNRVAKTTASGRFEQMEDEVNVRDRRELIAGMTEAEAFMGEERRIPKEPTTFVVESLAEMNARDLSRPRRAKLPAARVFKLGFKPGKSGKRWVETLRFCD